MFLHPDVRIVRCGLGRGQQDQGRCLPGCFVCPANQYIIYADYGFEAVEFYVDLAHVEPFSCQGPTGDINQDGLVGVQDLIILLTQWLCMGDCTADLNGDGIVNFTDIALLFHTWGECGTG